jgi:hypothetical protein
LGLLCGIGVGWLVLSGSGRSFLESTMVETADAHPQPKAPLQVIVSQKGNMLHYSVRNHGRDPVWAFLLVPSIRNGEWSFAVDTAWFTTDGAVLVVRKVDTPVPARLESERVSSGAVKLAPGESREGAILLDQEVTLSDPYQGRPQKHRVTQVVLEVGSLPVRKEQWVRSLNADGHQFAYLRPETEPGGQAFSRSPVLIWSSPANAHWAQ